MSEFVTHAGSGTVNAVHNRSIPEFMRFIWEQKVGVHSLYALPIKINGNLLNVQIPRMSCDWYSSPRSDYAPNEDYFHALVTLGKWC